MADYKGNSEKLVTSSYLYTEEKNLVDLLRSKFSENKTILDALGQNASGKLTFNNEDVASANIALDPRTTNIISLTENGLYAEHQSLSDYVKTKTITDNYIDKKTISETYIPYKDYTDETTKEILGNKIKKNTLPYLNLQDVGELDGVNIEQKLLDHLRNTSIHNVGTLNSILINQLEFGGGVLTNFIIDSDGMLSLKIISEKTDPITGEVITIYTVDKATFISKIYNVSKTMPWITYAYDGIFNPYLSNISMFVRYGTTATYDATKWSDWQNVTDDKSLVGINSQYIQFKVEAQTADRFKNIRFNYFQLFYGEDANVEISNARVSLDGTNYPTLKDHLDYIEQNAINALPKNQGAENANKMLKTNNLGDLILVDAINVDNKLLADSENPVQNKVIYKTLGDIGSLLDTINGTII